MADLHTEAAEPAAELVIGKGENEHRLGDVRVMLPGLQAQSVSRLRVRLDGCGALGDQQFRELCQLKRSCEDRDIALDLVGLDASTCERLRTTAVRRSSRRPA